MKLEELLNDRAKLIKIFWLGFITSIVFIGIGVVLILMEFLT